MSRLAELFSQLPFPNPAWLLAQVPEVVGFTKPSPAVIERTDLPFGPDLRHRMDVYTPTGAKDYPLLVFAHGGSWVFGSKDWYAPFGRALAADGIAVALPNYRLSPGVRHPGHTTDFAAAVGFAHGHAAEWGADPRRLFIGGHSAGGHLAALVALDPHYLAAVGRSPSDLHGVLGVSGVYRLNRNVPGFAFVFGSDRDVETTASPASHVRGSHPPFLLLYAGNDYPTFDRQADDLATELRRVGGQANAMRIDGPDHVSIIADAGLPDGQSGQRVRAFLTAAGKS